MSKEELLQEYKEIIAVVKETLEKETNSEWKARYENYHKNILSNQSLIRNMRRAFIIRAPLFAYFSVSRALQGSNSRKVIFDIRYQGQSVAEILVERGTANNSTSENSNYRVWLVIDKKKSYTNKRDFQFTSDEDSPKLKVLWRGSLEAKMFRKVFADGPQRSQNSRIQNKEHKVESEILTDMLKTSAVDKNLLHVRPVLLCGERFQMPTPFMASKIKDGIINYVDEKGGGIDILARIGTGGRNTKLCVIELKDENKPNESPQVAMKQAIAYATFIWKLLRDKNNGQAWWQLFGFSQTLPENLIIYPTVAMPKGKKDEIFPGEEILLDEKDKFVLQYIYLHKASGIPSEATSSASAKYELITGVK
ncbi:MAG: hypothetical protein AB9917_07340 [Negativicutes bacterium]